MPIDLFFLLTFEKIVKKSLFYSVSFQFLYEIPIGEDKFCWQNDFVGCVVEFCF